MVGAHVLSLLLAISTTSKAQVQTVANVSITDTVTSYIFNSQTAPLPEEWRALARLHILDTLASIVACRDLEPSSLARNYSLTLTGGTKGKNAATILGSRERASIVDAAFASAMAGHGAEINDFIPSAYVQPGPAIVSVALAVAETRKLSGDAVLRAVIAGYELAGRIPKALGNANLQKVGIANHGIGPNFGSAAAAASLLRLPVDKVSHMLAYCAESASGAWQWMQDVEHIEKSFVFAGMGARAGLHAALMVESGFRGVRQPFDAAGTWLQYSFFKGGDSKFDLLKTFGNNSTELAETGFKRYPSGGPTQPSVHGMLQLLPNITVADVSKVTIAMPGAAETFRNANMPALNLKYLLSIIMLDGKLDFVSAQSRQRLETDKAAQALMKKIDVVEDPSQEAPEGQPRVESAKVTVEETTGKKSEIFVPYVKGYPSHPMTREDVEEKAIELMKEPLGEEKARRVVSLVQGIEKLRDVRELIDAVGR